MMRSFWFALIFCLAATAFAEERAVQLLLPSRRLEPTSTFELRFATEMVSADQIGKQAPVSPLVFSPHDTREILAIAPWQIEKLALNIDLIYNAHSFVEMPQFVVSNYADKLARLSQFESTTVLMLTYDCFDLRTTLDPELLPSFFPTKTFHRSTFPVLDRSYNVISFVGRQKRASGQQAA